MKLIDSCTSGDTNDSKPLSFDKSGAAHLHTWQVPPTIAPLSWVDGFELDVGPLPPAADSKSAVKSVKSAEKSAVGSEAGTEPGPGAGPEAGSRAARRVEAVATTSALPRIEKNKASCRDNSEVDATLLHPMLASLGLAALGWVGWCAARRRARGGGRAKGVPMR